MLTCIRIRVFNICRFKSGNIVTLVTMRYIVGIIVDMFYGLLFGPKRPLLSILVYIAYIGLFGTGYAGFVFR